MTMSCVILIKHLKWRNFSEQIVNEIKKKSLYFKQKIFIQVIFTLHHCFHIDIHHRCHSHPTVITVWAFTKSTYSGNQFLYDRKILYISFELYCTSKRLFYSEKLKHKYNKNLLKKFWVIYIRYAQGKISACNKISGPIKLACKIVTYHHSYTLHFEELYQVPIWY